MLFQFASLKSKSLFLSWLNERTNILRSFTLPIRFSQIKKSFSPNLQINFNKIKFALPPKRTDATTFSKPITSNQIIFSIIFYARMWIYRWITKNYFIHFLDELTSLFVLQWYYSRARNKPYTVCECCRQWERTDWFYLRDGKLFYIAY